MAQSAPVIITDHNNFKTDFHWTKMKFKIFKYIYWLIIFIQLFLVSLCMEVYLIKRWIQKYLKNIK